MKHYLLSLLFGTAATLAAAQVAGPASHVNPFIGGAANGHTFPGACVPFGMVQTLSLIHI